MRPTPSVVDDPACTPCPIRFYDSPLRLPIFLSTLRHERLSSASDGWCQRTLSGWVKIWEQAVDPKGTSGEMKTKGQALPNAINPEAVAVARSAALPAERIASIADEFQALANPTRLRMLYALILAPLCVRDLALVVEDSESSVSHQLRILRDHHLVKTRREGNVIYYSLDDEHVAQVFREADYHADHVQKGLSDHP